VLLGVWHALRVKPHLLALTHAMSLPVLLANV